MTDTEEKIDFGFQERFVKYCSGHQQAQEYENKLLQHWDIVVPDLSEWASLGNTERGYYSWRVKNNDNDERLS